MADNYLSVGGDLVSVDDLQIRNAVDLANRLQRGDIDYADLVECRRHNDFEWLVFDVDVEVSQVQCHPIRASERVAVGFTANALEMPTILVLRAFMVASGRHG